MFDSMFPSHWSTLRKLMWLKLKGASAVWETITGNPVSFTSLSAPLRKLQIAFSPVQDLNGYDSPWPAGGGKNKFDPSAMPTPAPTIQYHAFYVGDGTWTASSDCPYVSGNATVFFLAGNVSSGAATSANGISPTTGRTQTAVDGYVTVAWRLYSDIDPQDYHIQIEAGSTITNWTPYSNECPISGWDSLTVYHSGADTSNPQTISISLGETVYSGWVDAVTGIGEVTWAAVDIGDLGWTYYTVNEPHAFYVDVPEREGGYDFLCSTYPNAHATRANLPDKSMGIWSNSSNKRIAIRDSAYTDATVFQTAMTGQTICYKLATPIPIQLTPQEINSLAGDNVMWSNANQPITVEYRSN